LKAEDGGTWELHSKTVKLSPHTGHTVTVTGRVRNADMHGAKEEAKDEMKEHGVDKHSTEHGHLNVTNLSMVSESCHKKQLLLEPSTGGKTCKVFPPVSFANCPGAMT